MGHPIIADRRVVRTAATGPVMTFEDVSASGPVVLLVHDLCARSGAWSIAQAFDAIRGLRRIVAVELPGCGDSSAPAEPWEREPYVAALHEVARDVSRRHGGALDLVAFGLGGELSARVVRRDLAVARSLAVIRPTGFGLFSRACRAIGEGAFGAATTLLAAAGAHTPSVWDPWIAQEVYDDLAVPTLFVGEPLELLVALDAFWRMLPTRPLLRLLAGGRPGRTILRHRGARPLRSRAE